MTRLLHKSFLDDDEKYAACERFWERLTNTIASSLGQTGEWPRWIPRTHPDGTPYPDWLRGNPIHDGRSERLDRGFRIMQSKPSGNRAGLAAWMKYVEPEYPALPRWELFLNLTLSDQTAALARKLLRKWMTPETTAEEMKTFLDKNVPKPKPKRRRTTRRSSSRS